VGAARLADVEDATDVRVRDLARRADFAEEPFERRTVTGETLRQELQRDGLVELEVFGLIDLPHPASAQQAGDPITIVQNRTRYEMASAARTCGTRRRAFPWVAVFFRRGPAHCGLCALQRRAARRAVRRVSGDGGQAGGASVHRSGILYDLTDSDINNFDDSKMKCFISTYG
jgi:hypothetical protein